MCKKSSTFVGQIKINTIMLFETNIKDLLKKLPSYHIHCAKRQMRELLVQKRRMLSAQERQSYSKSILEQLEQMSCFQNARTILLYYPKSNEVDVQSEGMLTLTNIINTLTAELDEVSIDGDVTFTAYNQRFADDCAGVYANVAILVESSMGLCSYR